MYYIDQCNSFLLSQICNDKPKCLYWTYNFPQLKCHLLRSLDRTERAYEYRDVAGPKSCRERHFFYQPQSFTTSKKLDAAYD